MIRPLAVCVSLFMGCGPSQPPVEAQPPAPRHELALDLLRTLGEATSYAKDKRHREATQAWGEAYVLFETHFEDELRSRDPIEAARAEYLFGQFRHELEQRRGAPEGPHQTLEAIVEELVPEISL